MSVSKKRAFKVPRKKRPRIVDEIAKVELDLYLENTGELYPQKQYIIQAMQKKKKRGKYDPAKAPKAFQYLVDAAAKRYNKEFGSGGSRIFDKPTREALAEDLAKRYEHGEDI
jgi:hypothetical protein